MIKNKKIILCLIALFITTIMLLCSCEETEENKNRLVLIEKHETLNGLIFPQVEEHISIYVDTQTGVQYLITKEGSIYPMVDENNNILIYEGDLNGTQNNN